MMDKITKILIVVCFVLIGLVSFMAGMLLNTWADPEKEPVIYNNTKKEVPSSDNKTVKSKSEHWDQTKCPYCGAPFLCSYDVPWYEKDGIMYEKRYREYKCGHVVFMGTDYVKIYLWSEEDQERVREDARKYRGRPPKDL